MQVLPHLKFIELFFGPPTDYYMFYAHLSAFCFFFLPYFSPCVAYLCPLLLIHLYYCQ
jgi:hypothetical protein